VEPFTELLLSVSISGNVFLSIARQLKEFTLIGFHRLASLNKVAELLFLPIHNSLRNVTGTESSFELLPGDDSSRS
jgi:hypothetical protein